MRSGVFDFIAEAFFNEPGAVFVPIGVLVFDYFDSCREEEGEGC